MTRFGCFWALRASRELSCHFRKSAGAVIGGNRSLNAAGEESGNEMERAIRQLGASRQNEVDYKMFRFVIRVST